MHQNLFTLYPEIDRVDRSSRSMRQKVESSRLCICESIESDRSMLSTFAQNAMLNDRIIPKCIALSQVWLHVRSRLSVVLFPWPVYCCGCRTHQLSQLVSTCSQPAHRPFRAKACFPSPGRCSLSLNCRKATTCVGCYAAQNFQNGQTDFDMHIIR